jgi:hypothetical protein
MEKSLLENLFLCSYNFVLYCASWNLYGMNGKTERKKTEKVYFSASERVFWGQTMSPLAATVPLRHSLTPL